jgi:hypothetical protein
MPVVRGDITIDAVLPRFLGEQRERLSPPTFRKYAGVMELLRQWLDGYAYQYLDDSERQRWEAEFEACEDGTFCRLFGPEKIPQYLGDFLDHFIGAG